MILASIPDESLELPAPNPPMQAKYPRSLMPAQREARRRVALSAVACLMAALLAASAFFLIANVRSQPKKQDRELLYAAKSGDSKGVDSALRAGANVNARIRQSAWNRLMHDEPPPDEAYTPLIYASASGRTDIARTLLDHGADVNAQSVLGISPLMMAVQQGNIDTVKLLISRKASIGLQNIYGKSAVDYSHKRFMSQPFKKIAALLGSDPDNSPEAMQ